MPPLAEPLVTNRIRCGRRRAGRLREAICRVPETVGTSASDGPADCQEGGALGVVGRGGVTRAGESHALVSFGMRGLLRRRPLLHGAGSSIAAGRINVASVLYDYQ